MDPALKHDVEQSNERVINTLNIRWPPWLSPSSRSSDSNRWLCSFSFPIKWGSVVLANCSLCGAEATLSYLASPVCSSFLRKPALFWMIVAGLVSTNKLPLLPFNPVKLSLCLGYAFLSPILLSHSPWHIMSFPSSFTIGLQWIPTLSCLTGNDTADELIVQGGGTSLLSFQPQAFWW